MSIAIITGSGGLVGAESVRFLSKKFDKIIGIDNNSRKYFFGKLASVKTNISLLEKEIKNYNHKLYFFPWIFLISHYFGMPRVYMKIYFRYI